jgi:hypothetical protein
VIGELERKVGVAWFAASLCRQASTIVMATFAIVILTVLSVVIFLRTAPRGTDVMRVRRFDRQALAYLVALCAMVLVLLTWRVAALEAISSSIAIFMAIFVPFFLLGAGLLRSRLLSPFHAGGRSTL